ncbi:hypothetical protein NGM37_17875, partial [Streptomyces sp. TRM76130]|nr:hypothetical protein [Streptomyces sp. TRM76130]
RADSDPDAYTDTDADADTGSDAGSDVTDPSDLWDGRSDTSDGTELTEPDREDDLTDVVTPPVTSSGLSKPDVTPDPDLASDPTPAPAAA